MPQPAAVNQPLPIPRVFGRIHPFLALDEARAGAAELPSPARPPSYDDPLFLMIGNRPRFLKVSSIVAVHAAGDYSEIRLAEGAKGLVLKSMKEWENRLPPQWFIRIHRSMTINLDFVDRVEELVNYSLRVYLKEVAERLLRSRRYALRLKQRLG